MVPDEVEYDDDMVPVKGEVEMNLGNESQQDLFDPNSWDYSQMHAEVAEVKRFQAEGGLQSFNLTHSPVLPPTQYEEISSRSVSPNDEVPPTPTRITFSYRRPLKPASDERPNPRTRHLEPETDKARGSKSGAAPAFDQATSYTESSGSKTPPPQSRNQTNQPKLAPATAKKRPPPSASDSDQLDYSPRTLKTLPFSTLLSEPFDTNPRLPTPSTTIIASPTNPTPLTPESHLQTLHTLPTLSPASRTAFYASQTQPQWVETTAFFEKRLGELFEELRKARVERREVAVRFEEEVSTRMEEVQSCERGIGEALGEIRGRARGVLPATPGGGEGKKV